MSENPQAPSRALVASYGVIIAAVVFAVAVVVLMNRFHSGFVSEMANARVQYAESQQYATVERHVHIYAQEAAEALLRGKDVPDRREHAEAAHKILAELVARSEAALRVDSSEETKEDAAEAAAVLAAFDAFVRQLDEIARVDRDRPDFQAKLDMIFDDALRAKLLKTIDVAIQGELKDVAKTGDNITEVVDRWTWGISILVVFLVGVIVTPLYLRLDKGVRRLTDGARRVASGDYATRVDVKGMFRQISESFNSMSTRIQEHRQAQVKMAKELQASSAELLAVAKQTETNAADEAAAVEETRRTMQALLASATLISEGADAVASKAEHSTRASEGIGVQILKLSVQSQKIRKITTVIQGIADKSDILALNASLEGAKAGDAGRGFVLLGGEMRRLAESVTSAAHEVADLASEIEELSKSAVMSTEVGQKFASETLEVAQRITLISSQQRGATEQVSRSMEEVHQYTQHSLSAAKQTRSTASDLVRSSDELEKLVNGQVARSARESA